MIRHLNKTKTIIFTFLVMASIMIVLSVGCAQKIVLGYGKPVTGSGVLKTQEINYSNFDSIVIGSAFNVDITRDDSYSLGITLDDNLFEYLRLNQNAKVLYISLAQNHTYVRTFQKATISLPILHQLELSGASQANIDGFSSSDKAVFRLSGASNLRIEYFKAGDTTFELSTASNVAGNIDMSNAMLKLVAASTAELKGTATNILIEGAGLSNARLSELKAVDVDVSLVGTSRASVNASGRLDAHLSNASVLNYVGNPTMGNIKTSGGSSISQK